MKYINDSYTVESVLCGHPDKICDQISDGLLDLYLEADKSAHTAIECLGTSDTLIVAGEVSSSANIKITQSSQLLYQQITGFKPIKVIDLVSQQSPQLETAIEHGGAGDQGVMYGYACRSKYNYLPYGYWLVNTIAKRLDSYRKETSAFLPDGKIQAVLCGNNVEKLTVNVQHKSDADLESLRTRIKNEVLYDIDAANIEIDEDTGFIRGGFENDTGLTGRKIMVDTYGGLVPHGGGAFSGKDPSKVDRSAAYMCRFVAKNIVANGYAQECCVSVSYNFGQEHPAMLHMIVDGVYSPAAMEIVKLNFDFRPQAIIERLDLKNMKYMQTATYGHFTNPNYPWEKIITI